MNKTTKVGPALQRNRKINTTKTKNGNEMAAALAPKAVFTTYFGINGLYTSRLRPWYTISTKNYGSDT